MTPFPPMNDFMVAGVPLAQALDVKARWDAMPEYERQAVVRTLHAQRALRARGDDGTTTH